MTIIITRVKSFVSVQNSAIRPTIELRIINIGLLIAKHIQGGPTAAKRAVFLEIKIKTT